MNLAIVETLAIRETASNVEEVLVELADMDLALVGGGTGDIQLG